MPGSDPPVSPASPASPDWGYFPSTVLDFIGPGAPSIDLRERPSRELNRALTRLGLGPTFGIITAQNPMGSSQSADRNAELAARLRHEIAAMEIPFTVVDACSPDRSHRERSVAVAISCNDLVEIASRYGQLAIFWFDGDSFWIVPARSEKQRVRLPVTVPPVPAKAGHVRKA